MSYSCNLINKDRLKEYVDETIMEEVYADVDTIPAGTTSPKDVQTGTVPEGYDGVIMGLAATQDADTYAWIKRAGKQVFSDGLSTQALGGITNEETPLMVKLESRQSWALGFTNNAGSDKTVYWRLRIRYIKKQE